VFRLSEQGELTNTDNINDNSHDRALAPDALQLDGAYDLATAQVGEQTLLFVTGEFDDGMSVFRVSEEGKLTNILNIQDDNTLKLNDARGIATTRVGEKTFVFVTGEVDDGMSVFALPAASNHTFATATNIVLTQRYSSQLNSDSDFYRILLFPGIFTFDTTGDTDTTCQLFAADNTDDALTGETGIGGSAARDTDQDYDTSGNCRFSYEIDETSDFFIKISGGEEDTAGAYTLQLQLTP
jgi:hypothetical protein